MSNVYMSNFIVISINLFTFKVYPIAKICFSICFGQMLEQESLVLENESDYNYKNVYRRYISTVTLYFANFLNWLYLQFDDIHANTRNNKAAL